MNNILKEQEYIQLFLVSSTLKSNQKTHAFPHTEYAVLYKNFEEPVDPDASVHLWLYPALDRTTPQLNNHFKKALSKVSKLSSSQIIQPTTIQLKKDTNGKPYFEPPYEKIAVSLSYTQQFGLLGLSTKTAIGVDIVEVTESFKISEIVNSHFHFSEQSIFENLDSTRAKNWFFNAWVLKEAALKSTGEGVAFDGLSKIVVGLMNDSYFIKDDFKKEKAIAGSITFKKNDTELVIGVSIY